MTHLFLDTRRPTKMYQAAGQCKQGFWLHAARDWLPHHLGQATSQSEDHGERADGDLAMLHRVQKCPKPFE